MLLAILLAVAGWTADEVFAVRENGASNTLSVTSGAAVPEGADALFDWRSDTLYTAGGAKVVYDAGTRSYGFAGGAKAERHEHYLAGRYSIPYRPVNEKGVFRTPPVGWMTWYAVKFGASDEVVMRNARAFKEAFRGYTDERPVMWVDWEWYHEKMYSSGAEGHDMLTPRTTAYPRGLRALSDDLRAMGFTPALWVSVINDVRTNSVWKAHPEWILGERRNWSGGVWADPTAPGFCEEFVPMAFRKYRDEWGYDAFKWDTVPNGLQFLAQLRDRQHDRTASPAEAFSRMVRAARRELGPDVYLESCAATKDGDVLSMIDLFDSGRIGDDIFSWAEFRRQAVDKLLSFLPFHSTVFWADADNLVLRKEFSTPAQARTRVTVYGLCGVPVTLGDELSALDAERIGMLRRVMPVVPVHPASLARGTGSGEVLEINADFARDFGAWQVKAWCNLTSNETKRIGFAAPSGSAVWDFWNDRPMTEESFELAPGDAMVVRVTPVEADRPTLVSVSRHITQGGYELKAYEATRDGAKGTVRCPGRETVKVSFLLPEGASIASASHPYESSGRIARLKLDGAGDIAFELKLK